jgi:TRAP-type C4-dicarboxylate transport system permease small subunit
MAGDGIGIDVEKSGWVRLVGLARLVIRYWALAGGIVLVALVVMTGTSALLNLLFNKPVPGDFEIVKHGVAIAAFAFLPYCQLSHANVTVDIFTESMSDRAKSAMVLLASLIAAIVAIALFRQMWLGMLDYIQYGEAMVSVPIKLWTAFPPALVSLVLLFVASLITAGESWAVVRRTGKQALQA